MEGNQIRIGNWAKLKTCHANKVGLACFAEAVELIKVFGI